MAMTDTTMIDRLKEFMECEGRSCSFDPENNREPDVYGPPASFEEPADSVSSTEYLPSVNVEPNVYGPPEVMGSSSQN